MSSNQIIISYNNGKPVYNSVNSNENNFIVSYSHSVTAMHSMMVTIHIIYHDVPSSSVNIPFHSTDIRLLKFTSFIATDLQWPNNFPQLPEILYQLQNLIKPFVNLITQLTQAAQKDMNRITLTTNSITILLWNTNRLTRHRNELEVQLHDKESI